MAIFEPWSIYLQEQVNLRGDDEVCIIGSDGFPVATVDAMNILPDYPERTGHSHWALHEGETYIERAPEDVLEIGRLIAAAPALLKAARLMVVWDDDTQEPCGQPPEECQCIFCDARLAVAAATGEPVSRHPLAVD